MFVSIHFSIVVQCGSFCFPPNSFSTARCSATTVADCERHWLWIALRYDVKSETLFIDSKKEMKGVVVALFTGRSLSVDKPVMVSIQPTRDCRVASQVAPSILALQKVERKDAHRFLAVCLGQQLAIQRQRWAIDILGAEPRFLAAHGSGLGENGVHESSCNAAPLIRFVNRQFVDKELLVLVRMEMRQSGGETDHEIAVARNKDAVGRLGEKSFCEVTPHGLVEQVVDDILQHCFVAWDQLLNTDARVWLL